jgi:hypothetical protein
MHCRIPEVSVLVGEANTTTGLSGMKPCGVDHAAWSSDMNDRFWPKAASQNFRHPESSVSAFGKSRHSGAKAF